MIRPFTRSVTCVECVLAAACATGHQGSSAGGQCCAATGTLAAAPVLPGGGGEPAVPVPQVGLRTGRTGPDQSAHQSAYPNSTSPGYVDPPAAAASNNPTPGQRTPPERSPAGVRRGPRVTGQRVASAVDPWRSSGPP